MDNGISYFTKRKFVLQLIGSCSQASSLRPEKNIRVYILGIGSGGLRKGYVHWTGLPRRLIPGACSISWHVAQFP